MLKSYIRKIITSVIPSRGEFIQSGTIYRVIKSIGFLFQKKNEVSFRGILIQFISEVPLTDHFNTGLTWLFSILHSKIISSEVTMPIVWRCSAGVISQNARSFDRHSWNNGWKFIFQICSLLRGGIAERGGVRVGHRIIEINNQSVVAVPHEKIVNLLATSVGEVSIFLY